MFGASNPFGQPSSSPFASQSVFSRTNNASSNKFAPKPSFDSPNPFGSQTGGSIFGGTSTGVFSATQSSSPFSSTTAFSASSSLAFGSTPTFSSSSSFGGSSLFGQKPSFGFGSIPTQSNPFGSTNQQPVFSTGIFNSSTPFGSTQSAFGSSPAFGATNTPAFGATSTPGFGVMSTPAFGATSIPAFGSTRSPAFRSTGTAFDVSNAPLFGTGGTFGASSSPAFGISTTPAFGGSSTPAFGASSTPSFGFGSTPAFGQSTPAFGSSPFGTKSFGAQSSPFGTQSSGTAFGSTSLGQSPFGGQRGGSRVAPYTPTTDADSGSGQPGAKLESISAMPVYKDKCHEELRWEDYQLRDKGGPQPASQPTGGFGFGMSSASTSPFGSSSFGQTSSNPFSGTSSNPFNLKPPSFNSSCFATSTTTSNPFQSTSSSIFGQSSSTSFFTSSSTLTFGTGSSLFGLPVTPSFSTSPSIFGTGAAPATTSAFATGLNFGNSQTSSLFNSSPAIGQTVNAFGQMTTIFGQNTSNFGQTSIFNTPSTGFSGNMFSSSPSLAPSSNPAAFGTTPSFASPFRPAQTSGAFSFSNFGQTQSGGGSGIFGQSNIGLLSATQGAAVVQPGTIINPYGTLPASPQMSIGRVGSAPSVQYGISSMPVVDKPAPVRISPLLTSRYLSQRRIRLPARKYYPNNNNPKIPFFNDDEVTPNAPKADAVFIPRENPRVLVIRPTESWPSRTSAEKASPLKVASTPVHEKENPAENGLVKERVHPVRGNQKANRVHDDHSAQKEYSYMTLNGHRAGEAAIVFEHGVDIEALMPKLRQSDYYTEPRIQELAAKERAEPGYWRHVKDFVVGRHGYGSIKFLGETDVRCLDLESLVQFNNREVIVYMDDSKKPPVGQGLNKPAVVTLLNIKCFDKKTGQQYTEGPKVEKYKEMLKRKANDQGAEFFSYDPIKGEWKFRVKHFSTYKLKDEMTQNALLQIDELS